MNVDKSELKRIMSEVNPADNPTPLGLKKALVEKANIELTEEEIKIIIVLFKYVDNLAQIVESNEEDLMYVR